MYENKNVVNKAFKKETTNSSQLKDKRPQNSHRKMSQIFRIIVLRMINHMVNKIYPSKKHSETFVYVNCVPVG